MRYAQMSMESGLHWQFRTFQALLTHKGALFVNRIVFGKAMCGFRTGMMQFFGRRPHD
jgi:hypothetical protein